MYIHIFIELALATVGQEVIHPVSLALKFPKATGDVFFGGPLWLHVLEVLQRPHIIRYHQISSNIIKYHQIMSNNIKCIISNNIKYHFSGK